MSRNYYFLARVKTVIKANYKRCTLSIMASKKFDRTTRKRPARTTIFLQELTARFPSQARGNFNSATDKSLHLITS